MKLKLLLFFVFSFTSHLTMAQFINTFDTSNVEINHDLLSFKPVFSNDVLSKNPFQSFDANQLPFFCRIEHLIENKSKIAFRFRLGDLNYVNMLENKR